MKGLTSAIQAGGYYSRVKIPAGATFDGGEDAYLAFSADLGKTGQGYGSATLTRVETNWRGEIDEGGFLIRSVGIEIIPDALNVATNQSDAYELLTKCSLAIEIDSQVVHLGPAYGWPRGVGLGEMQVKSASSTAHTDGGFLHRPGQRLLADPIMLEQGARPKVRLVTGADKPVMVGQVFAEIWLLGEGRQPVYG